MTLEIEDDLNQFLESPVAARELIIWELYRQHRISSGKAAELLGIPKGEFLRLASSLGVPYIDFDPEELELEFKSAESLSLESRL